MSGRLPGILVILSGPSGAGKTTIVRKLLQLGDPPLELSISMTTRPPRDQEQDGVDYHFVDPETFANHISEGQLLEHVEVFRTGHLYGTPRQWVETRLAAGTSVLLEIDVEGARKVLENYPAAVTIFLSPESEAELERRLRDRGTETEEAILRRLEIAKQEMQQASWYAHHVVNHLDAADNTVPQLAKIIQQEKEKRCSKN